MNIKYSSILFSLFLIACSHANTNATIPAETETIPVVTNVETAAEPIIEETSQTSTFDASQIPSYSGEWYTVMNNNVPFFTTDDLALTSSYTFSPLDSLGRCGEAKAVLSRDMMPTGERGKIGMIKPSGWQTPQQKYDFIDEKYLYNRCHLIGWQFLGDASNVSENLITGTRSFNTLGMLPFENSVAEYIRQTNHHVVYRVTPLFNGDNLVADGVLMEARSVEDATISFCIFVYNVEPKVEIDYKTGTSHLSEEAEVVTAETISAETDDKYPELSEITDLSEYTYIVNLKSKKIHKNTCTNAAKISHNNRRGYNGDINKLLNAGYVEAKDCF